MAQYLTELERADRVDPNNAQLAAFLAQYHSNNDVATTYEALREWLRRDTARRELPIIRRIFEQ